MRRTVTAVVCALTACAALAHPGRSQDAGATAAEDVRQAAATPARATMVVIGDSISAAYSDTGAPERRAWWSMLADTIDVDPIVVAEGGAGYLRRGTRCRGRSFQQSIDAHAALIRAAEVVVIEGGVNDRSYCLTRRRNGHGDAPSSAQQVSRAVRPALRRVAELAGDDATVIVTAPWGGARKIAPSGRWIPRIIEAAARENGLEYVDTATDAIRPRHRTLDGVHPSLSGSTAIAKHVYFRSSLHER
ncbi:hypothetical protein GEV29_11340 [Aeromicrobium sp. SMF47]|nr:hypothetical protein [Aeromicrobium yanjiei]MRK01500.1 hypothetical protein [Aeromicrobium sp. S22]